MTPARKVLLLLAGLAIVVAVCRLATGLGTATNLNDKWPWGLWIGFDLLTGVALTGKVFKHEVPICVLQGLVRIAGVFMILYLALKFYDLANRGVIGLMFKGNLEGNMFLLESVLGVIIPIFIAFSGMSNTCKSLITFGVLVSGGVIFNRMNVVFTDVCSPWRLVLPLRYGMGLQYRSGGHRLPGVLLYRRKL